MLSRMQPSWPGIEAPRVHLVRIGRWTLPSTVPNPGLYLPRAFCLESHGTHGSESNAIGHLRRRRVLGCALSPVSSQLRLMGLVGLRRPGPSPPAVSGFRVLNSG